MSALLFLALVGLYALGGAGVAFVGSLVGERRPGRAGPDARLDRVRSAPPAPAPSPTAAAAAGPYFVRLVPTA